MEEKSDYNGMCSKQGWGSIFSFDSNCLEQKCEVSPQATHYSKQCPNTDKVSCGCMAGTSLESQLTFGVTKTAQVPIVWFIDIFPVGVVVFLKLGSVNSITNP